MRSGTSFVSLDITLTSDRGRNRVSVPPELAATGLGQALESLAVGAAQWGTSDERALGVCTIELRCGVIPSIAVDLLQFECTHCSEEFSWRQTVFLGEIITLVKQHLRSVKQSLLSFINGFPFPDLACEIKKKFGCRKVKQILGNPLCYLSLLPAAQKGRTLEVCMVLIPEANQLVVGCLPNRNDFSSSTFHWIEEEFLRRMAEALAVQVR
jgi:hypothetical protein